MTDDLLFDVPPTPTPVERLLALACDATRHNDALSLFLPTAASGPALGAHADSAAQLAHAALTAVQAVRDQQLYASADLIDATVRIKQIAYLSGEAARHLAEAQATVTAAAHANPELTGFPDTAAEQFQLAQELTGLAPEAAVESATGIARETQRRRPSATTAADGLATAERSALHTVARGHVVMARSHGREYVHSRRGSVRIATLRSLEGKGLIARAPATAPPAFQGGPAQDRIRLTALGAPAVAALLALPPAAPASAPAPAMPAAPTVTGPARSR
ncbi:hypothetical protein ABZ766_03385 [Streptomyces sp. NPDC006670]|uniref:hypothetical protein n=1 Tax=Streptomyces sp. NPDC006670 TaxID=3154476 RepID=UPI0033D5C1E3